MTVTASESVPALADDLLAGGNVEPAHATGGTAGLVDEELVEEELLVEDVSIDGMCGVY